MWDGQRKFGKPRSNAERRKRHKRLYGTTKLPPRGTGLRRSATGLGSVIENVGGNIPLSKDKFSEGCGQPVKTPKGGKGGGSQLEKFNT